jgi:hypothetical protein
MIWSSLRTLLIHFAHQHSLVKGHGRTFANLSRGLSQLPRKVIPIFIVIRPVFLLFFPASLYLSMGMCSLSLSGSFQRRSEFLPFRLLSETSLLPYAALTNNPSRQWDTANNSACVFMKLGPKRFRLFLDLWILTEIIPLLKRILRGKLWTSLYEAI